MRDEAPNATAADTWKRVTADDRPGPRQSAWTMRVVDGAVGDERCWNMAAYWAATACIRFVGKGDAEDDADGAEEKEMGGTARATVTRPVLLLISATSSTVAAATTAYKGDALRRRNDPTATSADMAVAFTGSTVPLPSKTTPA